MTTKQSIEKMFVNIELWIGLPKYQAERRLDVFFGLYLETILKECKPEFFNKEDKLTLIPEFPLQKNKENNECTNIDYLVFNKTKKCVHAIELKTDTNSVDDDQITYYYKFKETMILSELYAFAMKKRIGRSGKKYKYLTNYIVKNALNECDVKGEVIYILPDNKFKDFYKIEDKFLSITFSDIVRSMEKFCAEDLLLSSFVTFLGNHTCK